MIVFGGRLFGKVEQVPGLFHVATQFFHVNFIPLLPTKSWVVLHGTEQSGLGRTSWQGIELRSIRWGSVGMAWLRFGLFVGMLVCAVGALAILGDASDHTTGVAMAVLAAGALVALVASYRIVRATGESIRKLGADPNVPPELVRQAQAILQGRTDARNLVR